MNNHKSPKEVLQGYSLVEKQGLSREITRRRIVNCPLMIDPEVVTLKKIMGDPQAGCISLLTNTNENLALLRARGFLEN